MGGKEDAADAVSKELRQFAVRRARDEVEVRTRPATLRARGVATDGEAAEAVAVGGLPKPEGKAPDGRGAGGGGQRNRGGRGRARGVAPVPP